MNKKQTFVTVVLVSLMGVMVFMQQFLDTNMSSVALANNNIEDMLDYNILDGNIVYKLPDNWTTEITSTDDYIVYNNNFVSTEMGIVGSIKVLNTETSVDKLIEIDKKTFDAEKVNNIKLISERVGDVSVKKLKYEERTDVGRDYATNVYYFPLGDSLKLKISFSAGLDRYKENYETVYKLILESFKKVK